MNTSSTHLSEQHLAGAQSGCPAWCSLHGRHDWAAESWTEGGRWGHSREFGSVTISVWTDRQGHLEQVSALTDQWDADMDDPAGLLEFLHESIEDARAAARFLEAIREHGYQSREAAQAALSPAAMIEPQATKRSAPRRIR